MVENAQIYEDYRRIEQAIRFIEANFKAQPSLEEIARSAYLSKYHFDRLFKRWAGISPMQFLQFMTLQYSKQRLADSRSLFDTAFEAGLSGPSRLHDLFVTFDAMTPGEFKRQAAGVTISYGFSASPFGECLLAVTERGICHLAFVEEGKQSEALDALIQSWPGAVFDESPQLVRPLVKRIFKTDIADNSKPFTLHIKGTNFQINVWRALLSIPEGALISYSDIAAYLGHPTACRAVANAIALNPVAYLIPCHRVITQSGKVHNYRWGAVRKKAIIGWEAARTLQGREPLPADGSSLT